MTNDDAAGAHTLCAGVALGQGLPLVAELAVDDAVLLVVAVLVQRLRAHTAHPVLVVIPGRRGERDRDQLIDIEGRTKGTNILVSTNAQVMGSLCNTAFALSAPSHIIGSVRIEIHAAEDGINV
jgi:hypothetical protein